MKVGPVRWTRFATLHWVPQDAIAMRGDDEQDETLPALLSGFNQRSGLAARVEADSGEVVYLPMTAINGFEDFMIRLVDEWSWNLVSRPAAGPCMTRCPFRALDWFKAPLLSGNEPANIRLDPSGVVLARGKVRIIY